MLVLSSSSGPAAAAETPVRPGLKIPPRTEQRMMTKRAKRRGLSRRTIGTSLIPVYRRSSRTGQEACPTLRASGRPPDAGRRSLGLHGLARRFVKPLRLVAHAYQKHGLLGILQNVD